jgi:hypothetical protein
MTVMTAMTAMEAMTATAGFSVIQLAICVGLGVLIIGGVVLYVLYVKREIADHKARKRAISSINEINEALKQVCNRSK